MLLSGDEKKLPVDGKLSTQETGILKRSHRGFAGKLATRLTANDVDAYIEKLLSDEEYAKASVNRITRKLTQGYNLVIRQNRLPN